MLLNLALMVIGAAFLFYGVNAKLKFWLAAGALVVALGLVSALMDGAAPGETNGINPRLPVVISNMMK